MIEAAHVRATVVNIRTSKQLPARVICDANVLHWVFYPSLAELAAKRNLPHPPQDYQIKLYPAWIKQALQGKATKLFVVPCTLAEFATVVERQNLEFKWITDGRPELEGNTTFNTRCCKAARYRYQSRGDKFRNFVRATLKSIEKTVTILKQPCGDLVNHALVENQWAVTLTDFMDATMIEIARWHGVTDFLSDDADLVTVPGITVYTANASAVRAAQMAGRLS